MILLNEFVNQFFLLNYIMVNPCTDKLSDYEYLEHMIPHHQVAIDMSNLLIKNTLNPTLLHLCRNIIRKQEYEIWIMSMLKKNELYIGIENDKFTKDNLTTTLERYYPKMSNAQGGVCDPLFFDPDKHNMHMSHKPITGRSYLEHMIPHHQVAINMSKRLLLYTNNTYLMDFCRKLIIEQQGEIFYMNSLLKNIS